MSGIGDPGDTLATVDLQGFNQLRDGVYATTRHRRNLVKALLEPQAGHRPLQSVSTGIYQLFRLTRALEPSLEWRSVLIEEQPEAVAHVYALALRVSLNRRRKCEQSTVVSIQCE